jgi:DNA-binding NarL/FixJ family response regulator
MAMRAGLRVLLEASENTDVIAEAASVSELAPLPPDTDILVLTAEAYSKSDLDRAFKRGEADFSLLLLSSEPWAAQELSGLPARAWGLLSLEASGDELLAAVEALYQGLMVGDPVLLGAYLGEATAFEESEIESLKELLTGRESEVLQLLAHGQANKQIAYQLGISEHTVKFHVSSVYSKLGVSNRAEAVRQGIQQGLIVL